MKRKFIRCECVFTRLSTSACLDMRGHARQHSCDMNGVGKMKDIRLNGRMTFEPKHFEEVAKICHINAEDARQHPGLLEYSFWANAAKDTIYIHEHYADNDALINHLNNMNSGAVTRLLELATLGTMECAAEDCPETRAALEAFGSPVNYYTPLARR